MLSPGGVSSGRGCVGWLVGVTGRLRDLLKVTSLWAPGLKVDRVSKLFGVRGLLGVLGVWVLLPGLLGDWVRPMTREVDFGLSRGRPTPQGLPERLPAGDWGLDTRLGRGSVSGSVLWRRGVWSRLLCGLLELRVVIFPTSASLARSFSTSGGGEGREFRLTSRFHTWNLRVSRYSMWRSESHLTPFFPTHLSFYYCIQKCLYFIWFQDTVTPKPRNGLKDLTSDLVFYYTFSGCVMRLVIYKTDDSQTLLSIKVGETA